ncbi:hypothetical protein PSCICN_09370 [Pseudomonas cichorii]|nr:hypothetical protein PSCICN_09370 [Pseudomonas cichorii]
MTTGSHSPGMASPVPWLEQRLGNVLIFAQPVILIACVAFRVAVGNVVLNVVDVRRSQGVSRCAMNSAIQLAQFLEQKRNAPAIDNDMVRLDSQIAELIIDPEQLQTHQRRAIEVERHTVTGLNELQRDCLGVILTGKIMQRQLQRQVVDKGLNRQTVVAQPV